MQNDEEIIIFNIYFFSYYKVSSFKFFKMAQKNKKPHDLKRLSNPIGKSFFFLRILFHP